MTDFRIGDKIRVTKECAEGDPDMKGLTGTISKIENGLLFCEDWSDGEDGAMDKSDMELVPDPPALAKAYKKLRKSVEKDLA